MIQKTLRGGGEIERALPQIARVLYALGRSYYMRAWHTLPREQSFTTYQSSHNDTGHQRHQ